MTPASRKTRALSCEPIAFAPVFGAIVSAPAMWSKWLWPIRIQSALSTSAVVRPTGGSIYLATNGGWVVFNDAVARAPITLSGAGYIGSDRVIGGRYFEGSIDEVAVYRTALSASQITNLFNGVVTPPSVTISIQKVGSDVQLSWPQGTLLESTNVSGPWTTNGAASPLLISNPTGNKYFRVQVQ